jgi:phage regulator Rha-like protein
LRELPIVYFEEYPYCIFDNSVLAVVSGNKPETNYYVGQGDMIPQFEFDKMLKVIRYCGKKLHEINQDIKKIKEEWHGEEEFKI